MTPSEDMRVETLGTLRARIVGGTDREGGGDGPVVVLMHGFGAPGEDLVPLWRVIPAARDVRWVFPEAPLELGPMYGAGRAWWHIDIAKLEAAISSGETREMAEEEPEGLQEAREQVIALLDEVERRFGVGGERIVLGGFSQGAMLACDVMLRTERPLAGLAMMSGTLLAAQQWAPRMAARRGTHALMSHGTMDPLLPFAASEKLRDLLVEAGWNVDFVPFRDGHTIPPEVIEHLGALVTRTTGA